MNYILSIDQGTSSTKSILFDEEGKVFSKGSEPLKTSYLDNGFVEQEPEAIIQNVIASVKKCLIDFASKGESPGNIKAIGISNQRETFLVWDENGNPLHNAIVWQCKRSIEICKRWKDAGYESIIKSKTGLLVDPYFSGSKLVWLYENNKNVRGAIDSGKAYFGTIDTWLLFRFTNRKNYFTDYTNASRTIFFNLRDLDWDKDLLKLFGIEHLNLPECNPSSALFGETDLDGLLPAPIGITGMIGDSHAAAFGEGCFSQGAAKATLGTGCSILMNTGQQLTESKNGMVATICWSTEKTVQYSLEGVIVSCGATIEWLKNELGLFDESSQTDKMATSVSDNGGVFLIPAFSGLGAPYWDMNRKASISGLMFGTNKNHIVRAALESIPYQIKDVITAMENDAAIELQQLMVDGGMTSNEFVIRFLTDLLDKPAVNIGQADVSALGAAYIAGLKISFFKDIDQLSKLNRNKKTFLPAAQTHVNGSYEQWKKIIANNSPL